MTTLLVFSITLFVAVLISDLARRSILSTAVLFLVAGFVAGNGVLGLVRLTPDDPAISIMAELALFSVLFTDGMRVGAKDLASSWSLPGRALLFGMPLTFGGTALLAHYVAGLNWMEAFLVGAVLSPTDPVFAAAIIGREEIPHRLRHLLNVESGLNDGLALPVVLGLLAMQKQEAVDWGGLLGELALGVVLGLGLPWIASRITRTRFFSVAGSYQPLYPVAIGMLVYGLAKISGANAFLAAFSAGMMLDTVSSDLRDEFHQFGELVTELLKLGALLVFGALISPHFLRTTSPAAYLFALLALIAVRPLALNLALLRSKLDWRERVTAAWFGPKGFASVVYGLLILRSGLSNGEHLFHLVALVITGSIIAHSSSDIPLARWFHEEEPEPPGPEPGCPDPGAHPSASLENQPQNAPPGVEEKP